jgi:hypothetical protein
MSIKPESARDWNAARERQLTDYLTEHDEIESPVEFVFVGLAKDLTSEKIEELMTNKKGGQK